MSWPVFFRLGYLTFPLIIISFIAFLHAVFPSLLKRYSLVAVSIAFGLYALIIIFAPEFITARMLIPFQLVAVVVVMYGVGVIVRACHLRLDGAVWFAGWFFLCRVYLCLRYSRIVLDFVRNQFWASGECACACSV